MSPTSPELRMRLVALVFDDHLFSPQEKKALVLYHQPTDSGLLPTGEMEEGEQEIDTLSRVLREHYSTTLREKGGHVGRRWLSQGRGYISLTQLVLCQTDENPTSRVPDKMTKWADVSELIDASEKSQTKREGQIFQLAASLATPHQVQTQDPGNIPSCCGLVLRKNGRRRSLDITICSDGCHLFQYNLEELFTVWRILPRSSFSTTETRHG